MADKIPQLIQHEPLATELLREVKASSKRWFIIALVELFLILALAGGFIWYITVPVDDYSVDIANESGNAHYIGNDMNGDFNYGDDQSTTHSQSSAE